VSEFHHEPLRGLPGGLPAGERILWQGSPRWQSLARRAYGVRLIAAYFLVLLASRAVGDLASGQATGAVLADLGLPALLMTGALALLSAIAFLAARAAVYTVTNRRIAIRSGIALQLTLNVPFARIDGASLRRYAEGTGDIPLTLSRGERVGYLINWPHMRPWRLTRTEPMLRCIERPDEVGAIIANAMREAECATRPVEPAFEAPLGSTEALTA
jgi:Bacterial PH domain